MGYRVIISANMTFYYISDKTSDILENVLHDITAVQSKQSEQECSNQKASNLLS